MRSDDEEENDFEAEDEDEDEDMRDAANECGWEVRADGRLEDDGDAEEGEDEEEEEDGDEGDGDGEEDDEEEDEDGEGEDDDDEDEEEDDDDDDGEDVPPATQQREATAQSDGRPPTAQPTPPHILRQALLTPRQPWPPTNLTIEAIAGIPHPSAVHALATSTCVSYLLTGSQDGNVRAYDFWATVNGGQVMTAQQRAAVGLGESVHKAAVSRGWWSCEVGSKIEPVFSLACESDALWSAAGTQSGPINLYSLRHQPGRLIHSLTGHTNVVSALQLLPGDKGLLSGSWDGTVKEWDLNTGQAVRTYPTNGGQISSLSLQPEAVSGPTDEPADINVNVSVGPDFFKADREKNGDGDVEMAEVEGAGVNGDAKAGEDGQTSQQAAPPEEASKDDDAKSSNDSLFDDDAVGEDESKAATPTAPEAGLALPGSKGPTSTSRAAGGTSRSAANSIPVLSPADFKSFSTDILLTSSIDGQVTLTDRRVGGGVGRLVSDAPPLCMSASFLGPNQVLAGRRNGTIDIWDIRRTSSTSPSLLRALRTPIESGVVSCVVGLPDGKHVAAASQDNIRLWNTAEYEEKKKGSRPPFMIIAGHHGGTVSSMVVDKTSRFLISASGDRGWQGDSTKVVLLHEIKW